MKNEKGQAIVEAAFMLPLLVFLALGMIDIQWALSQAGDLNYIVTETARCEAINALPCKSPTGPTNYANSLVTNLHLNTNQFTVLGSPGCPGVTVSPAQPPPFGTCSFEASYQFQPLGVWFPKIVITRTGIASVPAS